MALTTGHAWHAHGVAVWKCLSRDAGYFDAFEEEYDLVGWDDDAEAQRLINVAQPVRANSPSGASRPRAP